MYIFRGRGVFIDVYKADDKIATSGTMSLADIDLRKTYKAIDSVATGRIPSLFCDACLLLIIINFKKRLSSVTHQAGHSNPSQDIPPQSSKGEITVPFQLPINRKHVPIDNLTRFFWLHPELLVS